MNKSTPQSPVWADAGQLRTIEIDRIDTDARNDRLSLDEDALAQLIDSIRQDGLLQPVGVVETPAGRYRLVYGHRRLMALRRLATAHPNCAYSVIPAVVLECEDDEAIQRARGAENLQRADLSPVEEAFAVVALLEMEEARELEAVQIEAASVPGTPAPTMDDPVVANQVRRRAIEAIARQIAKSESWVRDRVYLARLGPKARDLVHAGKLPLAYAREIAKVADPDRREELAQDFAADGAYGSTPGDFRELRGKVGESLVSLAQAPWRLDVPFAGAPACAQCPHNSANDTGLFDHTKPNSDGGFRGTHWREYKEPEGGVCRKAACYRAKNAATNRQISAKARSAATAAAKANRAAIPSTADRLREDLGIVLPDFVPASRVIQRAREELEAGRETKRAQPEKRQPKAAAGPLTLELKIDDAYSDAQRDYILGGLGRLRKAIQDDPLRCLLLWAVLRADGVEQNWRAQDNKKRDWLLKCKPWRDALALVVQPQQPDDMLAALSDLCALGAKRLAVFAHTDDGLDQAEDWFCELLVSQLPGQPAPPSKEQIAAEIRAKEQEAAQKVAKEEAPKTGKKAAKKSKARKKGRAAR